MNELPLNHSVKKLRFLTVSLIFSGALNIGLITAVILSYSKEDPSHFKVRPMTKEKQMAETSLIRYFSQIEGRSFHELVSYLTNRDPVGDGYLKRDLALSALVHYHHFNIEKAISGAFLQRRTVSLGKEENIEMFPALSEDHYQAIIRYAYEEKWPLTAEGLFKLLKKWPEPKEASLVQAFIVTPEYHALQVIFPKIETAKLAHLVCEGSWDLLSTFCKTQGETLDLSLEKKRSLLLGFLANGSKTAAELLLDADFSYASGQMEDEKTLRLLSLLEPKEANVKKLCVELLRSPRSDAVWVKAAQILYAGEGEEIPTPFDVKSAIARFAMAPIIAAKPAPIPEVKPAMEAPKPVLAPKFREHIVKDGESLWKIARQYGVKVETIVKLNEIEKDRLYPGMTLRIPKE